MLLIVWPDPFHWAHAAIPWLLWLLTVKTHTYSIHWRIFPSQMGAIMPESLYSLPSSLGQLLANDHWHKDIKGQQQDLKVGLTLLQVIFILPSWDQTTIRHCWNCNLSLAVYPCSVLLPSLPLFWEQSFSITWIRIPIAAMFLVKLIWETSCYYKKLSVSEPYPVK